MNTLTYKGLTAQIEFSGDDEVFFGRIIGIDDIVTFHSDTVEGLKSEMEKMVDFYLETKGKKGKTPKKMPIEPPFKTLKIKNIGVASEGEREKKVA